MATKIRLSRHGKKKQAFFHIVVADSRRARDGKYIEKLGTYNPRTNPATIDINFDRTLEWLQKGAELTDTSRAILSYKGILYKSHLLRGVKKGAITQEQADARFAKWLTEKESKINSKKDSVGKAKQDVKKQRLSAESEAKAAREKKVAEKKAAAKLEEKPVEEKPAEQQQEAPAAENTEVKE